MTLINNPRFELPLFGNPKGKNIKRLILNTRSRGHSLLFAPRRITKQHYLPPTNMEVDRGVPQRKVVFQPPPVSFHVSLRECTQNIPKFCPNPVLRIPDPGIAESASRLPPVGRAAAESGSAAVAEAPHANLHILHIDIAIHIMYIYTYICFYVSSTCIYIYACMYMDYVYTYVIQHLYV